MMRMSPEEKKELDDWVEKEYPKSMKRIQSSTLFYQIGKFLIGIGVIIYIISAIFTHNPLRIASMVILFIGMSIEVFAFVKYFQSLSNED